MSLLKLSRRPWSARTSSSFALSSSYSSSVRWPWTGTWIEFEKMLLLSERMRTLAEIGLSCWMYQKSQTTFWFSITSANVLMLITPFPSILPSFIWVSLHTMRVPFIVQNRPGSSWLVSQFFRGWNLILVRLSTVMSKFIWKGTIRSMNF